MATNSADWMVGFLKSRSLLGPDGRILCLYRTGDAELDRLRVILRSEVTSTAHPAHLYLGFAPAFCLYAAEWWRRNYESGPWAWDGALASMGFDPHLPRQEIYPFVFAGLRYWKRRILQLAGTNRFLVTLACEGGLPLKLLQRERTHLWNFFRALLREFQVYGARAASPAAIPGPAMDGRPHEIVS